MRRRGRHGHETASIAFIGRCRLGGKGRLSCRRRLCRERQAEVIIVHGVRLCPGRGQIVGGHLGCAVAGVIEPLLLDVLRTRGRGDVHILVPNEPDGVFRWIVESVQSHRYCTRQAVVAHDNRLGVGDQVARIQLDVRRRLRRRIGKKLRRDTRSFP